MWKRRYMNIALKTITGRRLNFRMMPSTSLWKFHLSSRITLLGTCSHAGLSVSVRTLEKLKLVQVGFPSASHNTVTQRMCSVSICLMQLYSPLVLGSWVSGYSVLLQLNINCWYYCPRVYCTPDSKSLLSHHPETFVRNRIMWRKHQSWNSLEKHLLSSPSTIQIAILFPPSADQDSLS